MKYSEMTPERVSEKKEYYRNYQVAYYKKNKGRIDLKNKLYAQTHRADSVKRVQRYVARHKDKVSSYNGQYTMSLAGKWRSLISSAKVRNIEVSISKEDFIKMVSKPCQYCGESEKVIGIDRIDNLKGYTLENSAPCCKHCNMMKKTSSVQDFLSHITKVYNHNKEL